MVSRDWQMLGIAFRYDDSDLYNFLVESNKIEGEPGPSDLEYLTAEEFLHEPGNIFALAKRPRLSRLMNYVKVTTGGAQMRSVHGMNVSVGNHVAPPGGPDIQFALVELLEAVEDRKLSPFDAHRQFEHLHPFQDGNGRSGRLLWLWHMLRSGDAQCTLGFLHAFYYQTLETQHELLQLR